MKYRVYAVIFAAAFFVVADIFLIARYASWNSGMEEILPFTLLTLIAEGLILYSIFEFDQIVNPFTLYSIFIYIAGFSFLQISDRQRPYSLQFEAVLLLSIIAFVIGGIVSIKGHHYRLRQLIPPLNRTLRLIFLLFIFMAGVAVFVIEIRQLGYMPLFNLSNTTLYNELNENEITPLHNFIVLNSIFPAMAYILYKKQDIPFWVFLLFSFGSCFIIFNFFSRQIIMLFFFSMLMAVNYYKNISLIKLAGIAAGCVVLFIILGELRSSSGDAATADTINQFLREYAGINKPTNIIETYLSLYGGANFTTGDRIIAQASADGYFGYGIYAARPVVTLLPVENTLIYPTLYSSYTKLGTYLVDPFLDFRWLGVLGLNFLYGFLSTNSFRNYAQKVHEYYIVEWSLFMFCIFMCSFTNFFHMFFILFFFLVNRIAIR